MLYALRSTAREEEEDEEGDVNCRQQHSRRHTRLVVGSPYHERRAWLTWDRVLSSLLAYTHVRSKYWLKIHSQKAHYKQIGRDRSWIRSIIIIILIIITNICVRCRWMALTQLRQNTRSFSSLASDKWLIIILCVKAFNDDVEEEEARKMLNRSIMNIIMLI